MKFAAVMMMDEFDGFRPIMTTSPSTMDRRQRLSRPAAQDDMKETRYPNTINKLSFLDRRFW